MTTHETIAGNDAVASLLRSVGEADAVLHEIVQGVRRIVREVAPDAEEAVKYGGILFAAPTPFCGVYAYKGHVSLEFGRGCDLDDTYGVLEGGGKFRRHIKLTTARDLDAKHVRNYAAQALATAGRAV